MRHQTISCLLQLLYLPQSLKTHQEKEPPFFPTWITYCLVSNLHLLRSVPLLFKSLHSILHWSMYLSWSILLKMTSLCLIFFSVETESFTYEPSNGVFVLVSKLHMWEAAAGPSLLVIITKRMAEEESDLQIFIHVWNWVSQREAMITWCSSHVSWWVCLCKGAPDFKHSILSILS